MSDIEKRAIELRDKHCPPGDYDYSDILDAIRAALVPPDGYVLAPACPTNDMIAAGNEAEAEGKFASEIYLAMLSERPEPSNVKK